MFIYPGVEINPIECHRLLPQRNLVHIGPNELVELVAIHAEIAGRITQPDEARGEPGEI